MALGVLCHSPYHLIGGSLRILIKVPHYPYRTTFVLQSILRSHTYHPHVLQVIPTVGVGGEGAEGEKKLTAQLKHFRNLVDEQASKVPYTLNFLDPYIVQQLRDMHTCNSLNRFIANLNTLAFIAKPCAEFSRTRSMHGLGWNLDR